MSKWFDIMYLKEIIQINIIQKKHNQYKIIQIKHLIFYLKQNILLKILFYFSIVGLYSFIILSIVLPS